MIRIVRAQALVAFLMLTLAVPALAKGTPNRLEINGPGLTSPLVITDPEVVEAVAWLEDVRSPSRWPPPSIEAVYVITRSMLMGDTYMPLDQILYVVNGADGRGLVYYVGNHIGDRARDHQWYEPNPASEDALLAVLGEQGITFDSRSTLVASAPAPTSEDDWLSAHLDTVGLGALGVVGLLAVGALVYRRLPQTS